MSGESFLPKKGHYKNLKSYQKSIIIFDCTKVFCQRFLNKYDRTVDQMVQAARSGKQNILEGSKAAMTSAETELKLTSVARSSLEELLEDYKDYLRFVNLPLWNKQDEKANYVRKLSACKIRLPTVAGLPMPNISDELDDSTDHLRQVFLHFMETRKPHICANIMVCLIHQCNYLLDRQIKSLEKNFLESGGIREQMFKARQAFRNQRN